jgi:NADH dehydrogenase
MSQNGAAPDHWSRFLRSKGRAQQYVTSSSLQWTVLRPSVIFGVQDEFVNSIARMVRLTPLIFPNIGGGKALFQLISVHDVVEATVRCLTDEGTIGRILELGGPEILTLETIEKRIFRAMGVRRRLFPAPTWLLKPAVFVMEKTLPGAPVNLSLLELLKEPNVVNDNALMSYFNLDPRPFFGENIAYLKEITAGEAVKKIFTGAAVN